MELAVLFSGGKDSTLALQEAFKCDSVACLASVFSLNPESYMFHTPNIGVVGLQAEAVGVPLISCETRGEKEGELSDLEVLLSRAVEEYGVQGVVTGGVDSLYQASRFQRVCDRLGLWCFNPLWQMDPLEILRRVVDGGYEVLLSGVFAYPFDSSWAGRIVDGQMMGELEKLFADYGVSPSGEGGEIETTVLDAPFFKKKVVVNDSVVEGAGHSYVYRILDAGLVEK